MIGFMLASVTVQAFDLLAAQAIPAAASEIGAGARDVCEGLIERRFLIDTRPRQLL